MNPQPKDIKEIWLDVVGYEGLYMVSNTGKVKSIRTGKVLKPDVCGANENNLYETVAFSIKGNRVRFKSHKLVAIAFIPNPSDRKYVNHKDRNKLNNTVSNLEWVHQRENVTHSMKAKASKYTGVYWHSRDNTWHASITYNGRLIHCGEHQTEQEAAIAYKNKLSALRITNKYATIIS